MKLKHLLLLAFGFLILHSCKQKENIELSDPKLFEAYITSYTSGIISSKSAIQVGLQQNMDRWEANQEIDENLFSITPKVKGKIRYLPNNTLSFVPEERLKNDQKYYITFHLSKIASVDSALKDFKFLVVTTPQDFTVELLDLQSTEEDTYTYNGTFTSSDWLSIEQINKILEAKLGSNKVKLQVAGDPKNEVTTAPFTLSSLKRTPETQNLALIWDGKTIDVDKSGNLQEKIPAKGVFEPFKIIQNPDKADNKTIWINFSDALNKSQNFEGLITLNHTDPIKFSTEGNLLKVYSEIPFNGKVNLIVHAGIENINGKKTTSPHTFELNFEQRKPEIKLIKNGTILPSSQNLKINFQSTNLKAVDVKVYKIFENNVLQFLQDNELDGKYSLRKVAAPIAQKKLTFSNTNPKNLLQWNSYALDLSTLITPDPGAIYRVEFSFKKSYALYPCADADNLMEEETSEESALSYDDDYYYYEYYNWQERDNPCDQTYYYDRKIATNILASDLGVIVKKGNDNSYLFAVTDLLTTNPVAKANITIYDYQQQLLASLHTEKNGIAKTTLEQPGYFAVVKKDNNTTYVRLDDGNSLSVSNFDVDGQELQQGLQGYLYSERGVWRPGDAIYVGFILDDSAKELPENHPIKITLKDPFGKLVTQQLVQKNKDNHYVFQLRTETDAPTGNWEAMIAVGGAKFYKRIKIETIKPNRLKMKNDIEGQLVSASQHKQVNYEVNWLHGATAKNLKAEVTSKLLPQKTHFKGYDKYTFNNSLTTYLNEDSNVFSGRTDEQGRFSLYINNEDKPENTGMLKLLLTTKVHENGGDVSTDVSTATYSPYRSYVGIAEPEGNKYGMLETGKNNALHFIALTEKGSPKHTRINVTIYRVDWRWWWDSSDYGISNYSSSSHHTVYQTAEIQTNAQGKATYNLNIPDEDWGRYEIVATDLESGHIASRITTIDWPIWSGKTKNNPSEDAITLAIATDKKDYLVKDKAKISFPSSEGGRALISVENGATVLETHWVETAKGETVFELPITAEMAPNAYLNISMIQPHATTVNNAPIRLYGIVPIFVQNKNTKLEPQIKMPESLKPEQSFKLQVSEQSGQEMTYTLAIVEEGLLDLTRFATPRPWNTFYAKTALGVKTWDIYNDVIGAYGGAINQVFSIGGDEDLGGGQVKKANRFKPVVIFKGPYTLEKGKTATHDIKLPNYIGSVRTMVIASNTKTKAYGNAEKTTAVKKPLMILGSLPRRAVTGEKVALPVTVFAMENHVKNVQVTVKTDGKFRLKGGSTQQLNFEQPDEKIAYFDLEVGQQTGITKLHIEATSGKEKATYEVEMDIMNPNPISFKQESIILEPNASASISWDTFGISGSNQATLEFATFPGINLNTRLNYLINYPHGCSEQITSGVFPQLYLADFMDLSTSQKASIQRNVSTGIQKLAQNQLSDGSFTYWNGSRYFDDWSTSYIGHFYLEAEKRGYVLPVNSKANWISFQQKTARQWRFENRYGNDFAQAYRLYTLALAGVPDLASMNRLRETQGISDDTKLRLAAAYAIAGQKNAAVKLAAKTTLTGQNNTYFGSYERNLAMALETQLALGNKAITQNYAFELAEKLSSNQWMSTQTTAYSLNAMAQFIKTNKATEGIDLSFSSNGTSNTLNTKRSFVEQNLKVTPGTNSLQFQNNNNTTVYIKLAYSGVLPVGEELVHQKGLAIRSAFKTTNDQVINPTTLSQGTEFMCDITITNTTNKAINNVALTHIIPSGWEIVNLRYADGDGGDAKVDHTDIRDDRTNFYFTLGAQQSKTLRVALNASYLGRYYMPGIHANAMYDNNYNSQTAGQWIEVVNQ